MELIRKFFDCFHAEVVRAAKDAGVFVMNAPVFGESPIFRWELRADGSPTIGSVMLYDAEILRMVGQIGWNESCAKMARERVGAAAAAILNNIPRKAVA